MKRISKQALALFLTLGLTVGGTSAFAYGPESGIVAPGSDSAPVETPQKNDEAVTLESLKAEIQNLKTEVASLKQQVAELKSGDKKSDDRDKGRDEKKDKEQKVPANLDGSYVHQGLTYTIAGNTLKADGERAFRNATYHVTIDGTLSQMGKDGANVKGTYEIVGDTAGMKQQFSGRISFKDSKMTRSPIEMEKVITGLIKSQVKKNAGQYKNHR